MICLSIYFSEHKSELIIQFAFLAGRKQEVSSENGSKPCWFQNNQEMLDFCLSVLSVNYEDDLQAGFKSS